MKERLPLKTLYDQARLFDNYNDFKGFVTSEYEIESLPSSVDKLIKEIQLVNGVGFHSMISKKKYPRIADARYVYFYIMRHYLKFSPEDITGFINKTRTSLYMSFRQHYMEEIDRTPELRMYKPLLEKYKQLYT